MATKKTSKPTINPLVNKLISKLAGLAPAPTPTPAEAPITPPTAPTAVDNKPGVYRNEQGRVSGVEMDGHTYLGVSPDEANFMIDQYNKKTATPEGAVEMSTKAENKRMAQQAQNVGVLTPEQQAEVNAPTGIGVDKQQVVSQILQSAGKGAGVGAATGLTGGLAAGIAGAPLTAGLSIPALAAGGAALGAATGAITGAVTGTFAAFNHDKKENVDMIDMNVQKAKYNIRQAIMLANKGGDTDFASQQFNDAYSELLFAERQLKEQSKSSYSWATDVRLKQNDLNNYLENTLPGQMQRMQIALMKPDPAYIDYGLDANGEPVA